MRRKTTRRLPTKFNKKLILNKITINNQSKSLLIIIKSILKRFYNKLTLRLLTKINTKIKTQIDAASIGDFFIPFF